MIYSTIFEQFKNQFKQILTMATLLKRSKFQSFTKEQKEDALNKLNELLKLVENKQFPPMKEIGH